MLWIVLPFSLHFLYSLLFFPPLPFPFFCPNRRTVSGIHATHRAMFWFVYSSPLFLHLMILSTCAFCPFYVTFLFSYQPGKSFRRLWRQIAILTAAAQTNLFESHTFYAISLHDIYVIIMDDVGFLWAWCLMQILVLWALSRFVNPEGLTATCSISLE